MRTKRSGRGLGRRQIQQHGTAGFLGDEQTDAIDRERAGGAEESVVADFLEAAGEQMIQETAEELDGWQTHPAGLARLCARKLKVTMPCLSSRMRLLAMATRKT